MLHINSILRHQFVQGFCFLRIDRLAVFTHSPSVTNDEALEETLLTLSRPVARGCFQLFSVTIEATISPHLSQCRQRLTLKSRTATLCRYDDLISFSSYVSMP